MASIRDLLLRLNTDVQRRPQMDFRTGVDDVSVRPAALHDAGDPNGRRVPVPVTATPTGPVANPRDPMFDQPQVRPRTVLPTDAGIARATPRMRDMIAKDATPVSVNPAINATTLPMRQMERPLDVPPEPFGSSGEPFGANPSSIRSRRAQPNMRDFVADDTQYLRDLENQPRNWKDKTVDAIRALNTNFNGPGQMSPMTKRERALAQGQDTIKRDIAVEKSQADRALKEMVPVQLEDGTTVMAPARTAGALTSAQQAIRRGNDTLTARKARWKQMGEHERVNDALKVYNSGGANDPETLKAISETLGLPATLQAKFNAGEVVPKVDDDGEITLIDKRDGSVTRTGVKDFEVVKEKGRYVRQERSARAAMQRTEALIKAGVGKLGDPAVTESTAAELEDKIQDLEEEAAAKTEQGFPSQAAKLSGLATELRKSVTTLRESANKARTAQGVTGAAAPTGQYAGKRISRAKVPEFAKRHNMTEAEAEAFLTKEKAIIY